MHDDSNVGLAASMRTFLAAFESAEWRPFDGEHSSSSSSSETSMPILMEWNHSLLTAALAADHPRMLKGFIEVLHGRFVVEVGIVQADDASEANGSGHEHPKWRWLVTQLAEMKTSKLLEWDASVEVAMNALEQAIERVPVAEQSEVVITISQDDDEEPAEAVLSNISQDWTPRARSYVASFLQATQSDNGRHSMPTLSRQSRSFGMGTDSSDLTDELMAPWTSADEQDHQDQHRRRGYRRSLSAGVATSPVPSLLRSMASYLGFPVEDTCLCQICYEQVPISRTFRLTRCRHRFCFECFRKYIRFCINEGRVYPTCFYEDSSNAKACLERISEADLQVLMSLSVRNKYDRFKFNKENEFARQCPFCDHSQVCDGPEQPLCVCEACDREFCFLHSNAHLGIPCGEYEKSARELDHANISYIEQHCKKCPGCGQYVEKMGGCNQMRCIACQTNFCWICGAIIDDTTFPTHFQWWNIGGCPGNQMTDLEEETTCSKIMSTILHAVFFIVFGPPAFVLAVVSSLLCCCCIPCVKLNNVTYRQAFANCLCVSGYALLAPLVLVVALLLSPCIFAAWWNDPTAFSFLELSETEPGVASSQDTLKIPTDVTIDRLPV